MVKYHVQELSNNMLGCPSEMAEEKKFIPYGRQSIDDADIAAVVEALKSPLLTTGPAVDAFEAAFGSKLGAPYAVACMNGTAALHMSAMALDLKPDDVVIVPAITFLATANGPAMTGAKIVFSDVDAETGLITGRHLEEALYRAAELGRPRAVYPVHLNGQCVELKEIHDVARANDLFIVEDACHALGASMEGPDGEMTPVGSCAWSDLATFSFHPVKTIAMGEGGAVTCRDSKIADQLRISRNHGMTRDKGRFVRQEAAFDEGGDANPWYYEMQSLGHNYRSPDINCALGLSQLNRLDDFVEKRRELVAAYDEKICGLAPLVQPIPRLPAQLPAWHIYVVQIDYDKAGISRSGVMKALKNRGIGSQVHYIPIPDQPYWQAHTITPDLPGTHAYYSQILTLPLFFDMSHEDVHDVVSALGNVLGIS